MYKPKHRGNPVSGMFYFIMIIEFIVLGLLLWN